MSNKKNGLIQEKNSAGSVVKETEWIDGGSKFALAECR